ncbi:MAG: glutathione synthase [Deltaproteobacteria bacterium]|nr:glutathione synthase [Deltaproteobacteria bacterium]
MSPGPLSMLFVMDPIGSIDSTKDTTFVLMLAAQERGHRVLYCELGDLSVDAGRPLARVRPVELRREPGRHYSLGEPRSVALDDGADVVWQRKDPPVDTDYVAATQILALCRRALVLNRPDTVIWANEKLYALQFSELMPETRVTRWIPELVDFLAKMGGQMIVKPLGGKGGEGVFHLRHDDRNLFSILETATGFGTRWAMAQQYLPAVREGDKRILLLEGEVLGALLRVPAAGETRANLHVGGRPARAPLDDQDRRIVERIRPALLRDGLFFVGIDVIGGRLTEVNVTSPTGIQEIDALEQTRLELRVIEAAEGRAHRHRSALEDASPVA